MSIAEIDRYLFNEMTESERETFEDKFAIDDELFFEIAERENELVDLYVTGNLNGKERERFEGSLKQLPARRQKVENAKAIGEMIVEQKTENKTITIAERSGWFSRLFSFGPALQFASVGMILLLGLTSIFLWSENRRVGTLEQELASARQREADLTAEAENERAAAGDLTADLDAERRRIQSLEAEIAKLRSASSTPPANDAPAPTIATLILPAVAFRGNTMPIRNLELARGVTRVALAVGIPPNTESSEVFSVQLNGELLAEQRRSLVRGGEKSVALTVSALKLRTGRNELTLKDSKDSVVAAYVIYVTRAG